LRTFDPNVGNSAAHLSGRWAANRLGNSRREQSHWHRESSAEYRRQNGSQTNTTQLTPTAARDLSP
jgi:hypothetical protein